MPYELLPRYPIVGGELDLGYDALAADAAGVAPSVLAIDGPAAVDWERFTTELTAALGRRDVRARIVDTRARMRPWSEIQERTETDILRNDPVFATVPDLTLGELFATPPASGPRKDSALTIVFGPGAALAEAEAVWYVDIPKRLALAAAETGHAANLGQPPGAIGAARRTMFVDWPIEDRHRRTLIPRLARYVDLTAVREPRSLSGDALRASLGALVAAPFRTRPTFLPQPWGGRWANDVLGVRGSAPNAGLGYELIAPESGVLFGDHDTVEVALDLVVSEHADALLGVDVARRFDRQFPIRFDYLDTVGGGDLSVHCHPRDAYMREVFGLPYAQDESYYVMFTRPGARIHLGLREDADLDELRRAAERSQTEEIPFAIDRFVNALPAVRHQLYLIPAGTAHGSGEGNVVLEISATPYVYSLRLYDWMRAGLGGTPRPVQLEHAFANLDARRRGDAVERELVPTAREIRRTKGCVVHEIGRHPDLFFAVHRLDVTDAADETTDGRFHVLNLADGEEVLVRTRSGREHRLSYAETIVVPAAVGDYSIIRTGTSVARIVKAFVA